MTRAIALGPLEIVRGRFTAVARVTFTVPSVPTGEHTVSLCNDPCTVDGLGDIVGGWLRITQTTKEGRLIERLDDLKRDRAALNHADLEARLRRGRGSPAERLIGWWAASLFALGLLLLAASRPSPAAGRTVGSAVEPPRLAGTVLPRGGKARGAPARQQRPLTPPALGR